jgi:hypothetical protein
MGLPPWHRALIRRNAALEQREFARRARQTRADTSFTPVEQLAR